MQDTLLRQFEELRVLHSVAIACVEATDEDALIERVTEIIGATFFPDNFGVLLLDETAKLVIRQPSYRERVEHLPYSIVPLGKGICSRAILTGLPMRVADVSLEPAYFEVDGLTRSELCVPLKTGQRVIGVINAESTQLNAFKVEDERLLTILAGQLAGTVERLRASAAEKQRVQELLAINRISQEVNSLLDLQQVLNTIVRYAAELSKSGASGLFLYQPDNRLHLAAAYGVCEAFVEQINVLSPTPQGTAVGRAICQRSPYQIPDLTQESSYSMAQVAAMENIRAILAVPMLRGEEVIGGFVIWNREPHTYSPEEERLMQALANQSVHAVENARLFEAEREQRKLADLMRETGSRLSSFLDYDELLDNLLEQLERLASYDGASVMFVEGDCARIVRTRGYEQFPPDFVQTVRSLVLPISSTANLRKMSQTHKAVIVTDTSLDAEWIPITTHYPIRSWAGVPIIIQGQMAAIFSLDKASPCFYQPECAERLETYAGQVSMALQNARLWKQTREQARQVQLIIDTVPEGVILLDAYYQVVQANPAARDYLSVLTEGFHFNQPLMRLADQPLPQLLDTGPEHGWRELQSVGGRQRNFEFAVQPLEVADEHSGWVLVLRDVTEERANLKRVQMQERLATVGQLAAGIAHDFNNIMAAIVVYADVLALDPALKPENKEHLKIIQKQIQRATSLIRQILDFSRRSIMEPSPIDLLPFIKELDKLLGRVLPENILLRLSYSPGAYTVQADPTSLQQVFMNLALNARDAMPSGGILQFALSRLVIAENERPPLPELTVGNWVLLSISDNGIGIAEDILSHIFDPFYTTKPVGKGTGLGLAQVYGIIKQHGGSIDVQSVLGAGTTFRLYFPELPAFEQPPPVSRSPELPRGHGELVLVVEDDSATREALEYMLKSQNYRVLTAPDGIEALRIYDGASQPIDLVVSDIVMPGMGGLALYNALRQRDFHLPLLFMTGHPMELDDQDLLAGRQLSWLQKPFSMQEFINAIRLSLIRHS